MPSIPGCAPIWLWLVAAETSTSLPGAPERRSGLARALDSDLLYNFRRSPIAMIAAAATFLMVFCALAAPFISPQNPWDPAVLELVNSLNPPAWMDGGSRAFFLGTDDQGRDLLSAIFYGLRISLLVGSISTLIAMAIGIAAGLLCGYREGLLDAFVMRIADVQLTFPTILVALLIDGVVRTVLPPDQHDLLAIPVVILAISSSYWVQYARTVRAQTLVEKNKDYVQAARVIGRSDGFILLRHILPNVMGPVLVIATINLAVAVLAEATLSFLGVGVPATEPSLGTLINIGNNFLYSGEWWIVIFPGLVLAALVFSVNLLGDWLRDAMNPRLR